LGLYHKLADGTVRLITSFATPDLATTVFITFALAERLAAILGSTVSEPIATSTGTLPPDAELVRGDLPLGLRVEGGRLEGTVETLKPSTFTLRSYVNALPDEEGEGFRVFVQDTGVTGIGGEYGLPETVTASEPAGSHVEVDGVAYTPDRLFVTKASTLAEERQYWHSNVSSSAHGSFDVTYPSPTVVTHVRMWSHLHGASQNIARTLIYGDGVLIGEYGVEARPLPDPRVADTPYLEQSSDLDWRSEWSELAPAVTLAVPSPAAYTTYTFAFPDSINETYVSIGRMQLLNVAAGAAVPDGMFLDAPLYDAPDQVGDVPGCTQSCRRLFPSTDIAFSYTLTADAQGGGDLSYALAKDAVLPVGLTLSPDGVISGQTTAPFGEVSNTAVRALVTGSLSPGSYASSSVSIPLSVRQAVLTMSQDELTGRAMGDGDTLESWGGLLTQSDPALRPVYELAADSVRFTEDKVLRRDGILLNIDTGGGLTAVVRVKVHSLPENGRVFAFHNASNDDRIVLRRLGGNFVLRLGAMEMVVAPLVVGEWVTLAVSYDATTQATTAYKDGAEQATATLGNLGDLNFQYFALGGSANSAGTDISISHAAFFTRKLADIDVYTATITFATGGGALRLGFGDTVAEKLTTSSGATPVSSTLFEGELPRGLEIVDDRLVGTLAAVKPYAFKVRSVVLNYPEEIGETTLDFTQDTGVTGIGGQFDIPGDVTVVGDYHSNKFPRDAFLAEGTLYWHSQASGLLPGHQAGLTVTYPVPTRVTHVRVWSGDHTGSQRVLDMQIYGDGGELIAEYGIEARPVLETIDGYANWSELSTGVTMALPNPAEHTAYRFVFGTTYFVSLGKIQLLDVPADAAVSRDLFRDAPVTYPNVTVYLSDTVPGSGVLAVSPEQVTYSLPIGSSLPSGVTLSEQGVVSVGGLVGAGDSVVPVRALAGSGGGFAYTTFGLLVAVVDTVYTLVVAQLSNAMMVHAAPVPKWSGFTQSDPALQPRYDGARHVSMSAGQRMLVATEAERFVPGGGLTIVARIRVGALEPSETVFVLGQPGDGDDGRIGLRRNAATDELSLYAGGQDNSTAIPLASGEWQTVTVTMEGGVASAYKDGVFARNFPAPTPSDITYPEVNIGQTVGVASAVDYRNVMVYARSLTPAEITLSHLQASAMYMASMRELEGLKHGSGVPHWDSLKAPEGLIAPVYDAVNKHVTFQGDQANFGVTDPLACATISSGTGVTVILRLRVRDFSLHARIVELNDPNSSWRYIIKYRSAGLMQVYTGGNGTTFNFVEGEWATMAMSVDFASQNVLIHVNGVKIRDYYTSALPVDGVNFVNYHIMGGPNSFSGTRDADVSHSAMWTHALSDAEVQAYVADITPPVWSTADRVDISTAVANAFPLEALSERGLSYALAPGEALPTGMSLAGGSLTGVSSLVGSVDTKIVAQARRGTTGEYATKTFSIVSDSWAGIARGGQLTSAGPVERWGVGKTFVQSVPAARPTFDAVGEYVSFVGAQSQFLEVTDPAARDMRALANGGCSIVMRLRSTGVGAYERFFDAGYGANSTAVGIYRQSTSNSFGFQIFGNNNVVVSGATIPADEWVTIAVSFDVTNNTINTCRNSVTLSPTTMSITSFQDDVFTHMRIGRSAYVSNNYLTADISHLSTYHRPLSEQEMVLRSDEASIDCIEGVSGIARGTHLITAGPVASWGVGKTFVQGVPAARPTFDAVGKYVSFVAAQSQFLEVTDPAARDMKVLANGGCSVVMRLRSTGVNKSERFFDAGYGDNSSAVAISRWSTNDQFIFSFFGLNTQVTGATIPANEWVTIAVAFDVGASVIRVCRNNVVLATTAMGANSVQDGVFTHMRIGKSPFLATGDGYLSADISHLLVYHHVLSNTEMVRISSNI
jgi:hypothetical protein